MTNVPPAPAHGKEALLNANRCLLALCMMYASLHLHPTSFPMRNRNSVLWSRSKSYANTTRSAALRQTVHAIPHKHQQASRDWLSRAINLSSQKANRITLHFFEFVCGFSSHTFESSIKRTKQNARCTIACFFMCWPIFLITSTHRTQRWKTDSRTACSLIINVAQTDIWRTLLKIIHDHVFF